MSVKPTSAGGITAAAVSRLRAGKGGGSIGGLVVAAVGEVLRVTMGPVTALAATTLLWALVRFFLPGNASFLICVLVTGLAVVGLTLVWTDALATGGPSRAASTEGSVEERDGLVGSARQQRGARFKQQRRSTTMLSGGSSPLALAAAERADALRRRGVALLSTFAVLAGAVSGHQLFVSTLRPLQALSAAPAYDNVLADADSGRYADAGVVRFAPGTFVATDEGIGLTSATGQRFCVAPMVQADSGPRVGFWAVGNDCCAPRGSFRCGESEALAGTGALFGVVSTEVGSQGEARYLAAAALSAANSGRAMPSQPLLLLASRDVTAEVNTLRHRALMMALQLFFSGAGFLVVASWLVSAGEQKIRG